MKTKSLATLNKIALAGGAVVASAASGQASTDYAPAIWKPLCQANYYTTGYGHKFFVVHDMEGYYAYTCSWFTGCNPPESSVHFATNGKKDVTSDAAAGEISQLGVRTAQYAWHARCWNKYSLGTEHEGFVSNPAWFTDEQYTTSASCTKAMCDQFGIAKDRNHIVGHGEKSRSAWVTYANANLGIDATCNTHTDPGQYWDWTKYMALIRGTTTTPSMSLNYSGTAIPNGDSSPTAAKGTDFGTVIYGSESSHRTFTIKNDGAGPLNLTGAARIQKGGNNPSDFLYFAPAPSTPVAANGGSTTFILAFEPGALGERSATISIPNDDPNKNPYTFTVKGTGVIQQRVDPSLEYNGVESQDDDQSPTVNAGTDFASVNIGSQSATHSFRFYNYGTVNMTLTGSMVQLSGANSSDFAIVSMPSSPIAPDQYSTIGIRFQPTGSGLRTASMLIYYDDTYGLGATSPYTVALQGTGSATQYTINASAGSGGSISPSGNITKTAGSSQSFTANPNGTYVVNQWLVDGSSAQTGGTSYTLSDIQANRSVQVTFTHVPTDYTITATAGNGGSISPNGNITKTAGSSQSFTANPNANYVVNQWLVDGDGVQTGGTSYTLPDIQANRSVQVTFTHVPTLRFHPADANQDGRLAIDEITAYGAAWKLGNTWPTPPNPININYVTRAGYLWKNGETYHDSGGNEPSCWVNP